MFVGGDDATLTRGRAHLVLGQAADGEMCGSELFLRQREEEIRLVLVAVDRGAQHMTVEDLFHAGVVTGGDLLRAQAFGVFPQRAELDLLVAAHTRIRRLAIGVGLDETVDHSTTKIVDLIDDVVTDASALCHRPGINGLGR